MDTSSLISPESAQEVVSILQNAGANKLLMAGALLVVMLLITHFLVRLFKRFLAKSKYISKSLHTLLVYTLRFLLILISFMVAANSVGVPITTFVAVFSILGIAVTLAIQGVLSNVAGCLILVTGKQFEVGDYIETEKGSGTVKDISLLYTELANPSGTRIYIPNSTLYTSPVTNVSKNGQRRLAQVYSAAYAHPPKEVFEALREVVGQLPAILPDPAPNIVIDSYARTYINYKIMCWTKGDDYWPTIFRMNELVYEVFAQKGIQWCDPNIQVVTTD